MLHGIKYSVIKLRVGPNVSLMSDVLCILNQCFFLSTVMVYISLRGTSRLIATIGQFRRASTDVPCNRRFFPYNFN